jgi:hypothetical protein
MPDVHRRCPDLHRSWVAGLHAESFDSVSDDRVSSALRRLVEVIELYPKVFGYIQWRNMNSSDGAISGAAAVVNGR